MAEYIKDGDIASITDVIAAYISNSAKYKNQDQFAEPSARLGKHFTECFHITIINVSIKVFFNAIEQIHQDLG